MLQVASEHQARLKELAATGARITFVAAASRNANDAMNVIVTVPGRRAELPPLVVMTPRSGWWHCAAERGGGLACWMESIRAVSAAKPARTATSSPRAVTNLAISGSTLLAKHLR